MNYLAHAALSPSDSEVMLGNLIADHVKGRELGHFPGRVVKGIRLHRFIDGSFDRHQNLNLLKEQLPQGLRRYAGIAIDLWFDHLLARDWHEYYPMPLSEFQQQTTDVLKKHHQLIPETQTRFIAYLIQEQLFLKYQQAEQVLTQGQMVAQRLTHGAKLIECIQQLSTQYQLMNSIFPDIYQFMVKETQAFLLTDTSDQN